MARRIVTGNRADGTSYFVSDGETQHRVDLGRSILDDIWVDEPGRPASDNDYDPVASGYFQASCAGRRVGGARSRRRCRGRAAICRRRRSWRRTVQALGYGWERWSQEDPAIHTTPTIDYGIVLEGEVVLELDEGETVMRAGDIVVQRQDAACVAQSQRQAVHDGVRDD